MTIFDPLESGGALFGGEAPVAFVHGTGQTDAGLVVEWDLDGDGDFDETEENLTATDTVKSIETMTGRDFPSQLTGRAGPGQLKLEVRNHDGRFSFFNAASPLNTPPFSVRNGGKIRVRTAEAANPDPTLLARDRFRGSGGLGSDELGKVWTNQAADSYTRVTDSTGRTMAQHVSSGSPTVTALATVDVGVNDFYVQTRIRALDSSTITTAGIAYRFQDSNNFGSFRIANGGLLLRLLEVSGGVTTVTTDITIEPRDDVTIGLLVVGSTAVVYLEGVPIFVGAAYVNAATKVGIRSAWDTSRRPPRFDEFYVWSDVKSGPTEGILWTGKVTTVTPHAALGQVDATATITAEGPLLDASRIDIDPPATVGDTAAHNGTTTGSLVGATLSAANLLHPPGPISAGTITPGPVGLVDAKALDVARLFEEVELGFLYETQEGRIGFAGRGDRVGAAPAAWFSDDPGAQFGYSTLELGDWRREVFNRVRAGLSPRLPIVHAVAQSTVSTGSGVDNDVTFALPNAGTGAAVGDLFVVVIASTVGSSGNEWLTPIGWKSHRDAKDFIGKLRIYSKIVETGDLGANVTFFNDASAGGAWLAFTFTIKNWFGDMDQGLAVPEPLGVGAPSGSAAARIGVNTPPAVFPSWGPGPSLFLAFRAGMTALSATLSTSSSDGDAPNGYANTSGTLVPGSVPGFAVTLQRATREACVQVEAPSPWASGTGRFAGFEYVEDATIAVRGFSGSPPEPSGGQIVQVDDTASQDALSTILTHDNAAQIFPSEAVATAYGQAVLIAHTGEKPIFTLSFPATLSAAYRMQAVRRRVSDKIALQADGATGMGVTGEFFIEAIGHSWSAAGKQWWVTWQLSPA